MIAVLKEKLNLNGQQIQEALEILGERNIPPERLAPKLVEIAQRFKALQEQIASTQPGDDAQKAINAGDLTKADALLAKIETQQRQALDRFAINVAETSARRGDIAVTRLQYGEAAKPFAKAATALPSDRALASKPMGGSMSCSVAAQRNLKVPSAFYEKESRYARLAFEA